MSSLLNESIELTELREKAALIARKYDQEYFLDRSAAHQDINEFWAELGAAGLLGIHLPVEYGGGGKGLSELAVVVEELASHGLPMLNMVISPAICGLIIAEHGSDKMKQEWLPGLAAGTKMLAFAITEPGAGSNSHELQTVASRTETGGWLLNGTKHLVSNVDRADGVLVVARAGDIEPDHKGRNALSLFIVPTGTAGYEFERLETAVLVPWWQFTLRFSNVVIEDDALIGQAGKGFQQVFAGLNPERILAASISSGIGRYSVARAVDYAKERTVWSTPIGAHQGISHPLAEAHIQVELGRLATHQAARLHDLGVESAEAANAAKFVAADASLQALDQAIQTHGGLGLSKEKGLTDLWWAARMLRTAPVSREMVLNFVAQTSLGLPRSY